MASLSKKLISRFCPERAIERVVLDNLGVHYQGRFMDLHRFSGKVRIPDPTRDQVDIEVPVRVFASRARLAMGGYNPGQEGLQQLFDNTMRTLFHGWPTQENRKRDERYTSLLKYISNLPDSGGIAVISAHGEVQRGEHKLRTHKNMPGKRYVRSSTVIGQACRSFYTDSDETDHAKPVVVLASCNSSRQEGNRGAIRISHPDAVTLYVLGNAGQHEEASDNPQISWE